MALFAGDIKNLDPLKKPLGGINQKAQGSLQATLGKLNGREQASQVASGRVQGSYVPEAIGQAGASASHGIEDALAGILGQGSYKDFQSEQDFQRNMQLANEIGDISRPSTLMQVLGGLGGAAKAGGQFAGLYNQIGSKGGGAGSNNYGIATNPFYASNPFADSPAYDWQTNWRR